MKRILATALLAAAFAAAWLSTPPVEASPAEKPARVVVVLAPYLTWEDVTPTSTPTIWGLSKTGAIGDINARSRSRQQGEPSSPLEGALTLSAGSWAVPAYEAPGAFNVDESFEVGTAAEAYRRMADGQVGDNRIVFLGMPMTDRTNADRSFVVVLGTLGNAIEEAGGFTAAVGNSDVGYSTGDQRKIRPAALAAMNEDGLVRLGDVSQRLLRPNALQPFGLETDLSAFDSELSTIAAESAAAQGPGLIVLDPGDSYRAVKFAPFVSDDVAAKQRLAALGTLDAVVGMARDRFPDAVVILASQAALDSLADRTEGLGPVVVSGPGWGGVLTSSSTRRLGIVTNLDVTATILDIMGVERPVEVLGNSMTAIAAPNTIEGEVGTLSRLAATTIAIDKPKSVVINTFVIITVLGLLIAAIVIVRSRHWRESTVRGWEVALKYVLLLVVSAPISSWLMFVWMPRPQSVTQAMIAFVVTMLALWVFGIVLWHRGHGPARVAVAGMSLLTSAVLLVDQWLGAPWSITGLFGYSPLLAARFYGIGNEGAAMLVGSSVVGLSLLLDEWPDAPWTTLVKRWGIPLLGIVVVGTAAAPFLGANVGVVAWGVIGFGIAWVLMNDKRMSWRTFVGLALVVVLVVGIFAAIDLFGGGSQTHLGRAIGSAEQGGLVELWNIVARKAETNTRVLTHTNWAYILIAVLLFLGFMRWRPVGEFADVLAENPAFADAITVCLGAGLVAYFTEDSGIVIPALIVLYVGVAIAWLMVSRARGRAEDGSSDAAAPATGSGESR